MDTKSIFVFDIGLFAVKFSCFEDRVIRRFLIERNKENVSLSYLESTEVGKCWIDDGSFILHSVRCGNNLFRAQK